MSKPTILTNENYFSQEMSMRYMSVSQFKDFAGTLMHSSCEMSAYKNIQGLLPKVMTKPLLVGSYIDAFYEGTLDEFKYKNRELICTKASIKAYDKSHDAGDLQLLADFKQAELIIERTRRDPLFTAYMDGKKQVIMTASLFGTEWKIKMDAYHEDDKIVDLKIMRSMEPIWSDKFHMKSDFIRYWGYDIQGAIYQKVTEIVTGKKLPFFIAAATKEDVTNIEVIQIDQPYLDDALDFVKEHMEHVLDVKNGRVEPVSCGKCFSCRQDKKLQAPLHMADIMPPSASVQDDDMLPVDETDGKSTPEMEPFHLFGTPLA